LSFIACNCSIVEVVTTINKRLEACSKSITMQKKRNDKKPLQPRQPLQPLQNVAAEEKVRLKGILFVESIAVFKDLKVYL
jgi:hypothetical protein